LPYLNGLTFFIGLYILILLIFLFYSFGDHFYFFSLQYSLIRIQFSLIQDFDFNNAMLVLLVLFLKNGFVVRFFSPKWKFRVNLIYLVITRLITINF